jgi:DGQHR domain-containing protein
MSTSEAERLEHKKMRNRLFSALSEAGFKCASSIKGKYQDGVDFEIDVGAHDQNVTILFECKTGSKGEHVSNAIDKMERLRNALASNASGMKIVSVEKGKWPLNYFISPDLKGTVIIAKPEVLNKGIRLKAKARGVHLWESSAIRYYERTVKAQGDWTKNEIFKELEMRPTIPLEEETLPAIRLEQPGGKFYLTAMDPETLLRIAYVRRRAQAANSSAYQRLVKANRLEDIRRYLLRRVAQLPNDIIISFDPSVRKIVDDSFKISEHKLGIFSYGTIKLPKEYCCAWVVDGQHRLLGFLRTRFRKPINGTDRQRFDLVVLATTEYDEIRQAQTFIDINDNQRKIDATLLCDLSSIGLDLSNQSTWPSQLCLHLGRDDDSPWYGLVSISELDEGPISLSGLVNNALKVELLRYKNKEKRYVGPLFDYYPFYNNRSFFHISNQEAFKAHLRLLKRFFRIVRNVTTTSKKDPWVDTKRYSIARVVAANALLLVLLRILEHPKRDKILHRLERYLEPVGKVSFSRRHVARYSGWKGFRGFANEVIKRLNYHRRYRLKLFEVK